MSRSTENKRPQEGPVKQVWAWVLGAVITPRTASPVWRALGLAVLAPLLAGSVATGCKKETATRESGGRGGPAGSGSGRGGKGALSFAVDVFPVEAKRLDYLISAPGTVDAFEHVQVTARVSGAVDRVSFREGQQVKKGDTLVTIDAERYRLSVNTARAALDKSIASRKDAEAMIARREGASEKHPGLIPGEELATYQTKGLTAKADEAVSQEGLRSAQLNLRDAVVRAPMDGVIQTRTIETGQYVQPGYIMATLLQNDPMLLRFQVSPQEAPRLKVGMVATFKLRESLATYSAHITLIAAAADLETHLVNVQAEVNDEGHKYWLRPGSFADVTVKVGAGRDAVVIPRAAVRPSERGYLAFVVDGAVARERVLQLGMNTSDGWVEVRDGLKPGERLVLRGGEALSDGSKVKVNEIPAPVSSALPGAGALSGAAAAGGPPPGGRASGPAGSGAPGGRGAPGGQRGPAGAGTTSPQVVNNAPTSNPTAPGMGTAPAVANPGSDPTTTAPAGQGTP